LIAIDKAASGYGLTDTSAASVVFSPINIFSYLGGVSIIAVSTVIAHISFKRGV